MMSSGRLEVDLAAIEANWRILGRKHPSGPVAAVLKANAYGLGAPPIAQRLYAAGCRHFFTATLAEADSIRPQVGASMVGVLHGLGCGIEGFLQPEGPVPVLNSLADVRRWAAAGAQGGPRPAMLNLDTGMARLGLGPDETEALARDRETLRHLNACYVMSHLASSEQRDATSNPTQLDRFLRACAALPAMPRSLANSSGIFLGPAYGSDLARAGAALFGINPTPGHDNPMRPVVRLRSPVLQVREIAVGDSVGYGSSWTACRPSRIATVGVGYADGWPRALFGRATASFDGRPVPLVGRVSMDLSTYDVTDAPGVAPGAMLELVGPDTPLESVAAAAGTIAYEILTSLGHRYQRIHR